MVVVVRIMAVGGRLGNMDKIYTYCDIVRNMLQTRLINRLIVGELITNNFDYRLTVKVIYQTKMPNICWF